jgi:hypothetical protein
MALRCGRSIRNLLSGEVEMAVVYEWDIESRTVYEDGSFDINDHNFSDTLEWYCKGNYLAEVDGKHFVLVLIRKVYDDYTGGLLETSYAEANRAGGMFILPDYFDDGQKVPLKYKQEHNKIPVTVKVTVTKKPRG